LGFGIAINGGKKNDSKKATGLLSLIMNQNIRKRRFLLKERSQDRMGMIMDWGKRVVLRDWKRREFFEMHRYICSLWLRRMIRIHRCRLRVMLFMSLDRVRRRLRKGGSNKMEGRRNGRKDMV
jgi:hypothetical protein